MRPAREWSLERNLPWLRPGGKLLAGVALCVLVADVVGRAMGWGALGKGNSSSAQVALTFDDGPSDQTPELLRVLANYGVKATFFVTKPACDAYPHELASILQAGHQVEAHGRWHTHALLLPPWREWAQVAWHPRAGEGGLHLYRPPYGGHSPLTRLIARLTRRQIALWDVEGRDWTAAPATALAELTLAQVKGGSVILLHDGPAVTPALLGPLLAGLRRQRLQAVTLRELNPSPITFLEGLRRVRHSYGA